MRKILINIILVLQLVQIGNSQIGDYLTIPEFIDSTAKATIARLAHPISFLLYSPDNSKTYIMHNAIYFDINYSFNLTVIRIDLENSIMKNTEVIFDTHEIQAFNIVSLDEQWSGTKTKFVAEKLQKQVRSYYEELFSKSTSEFSGEELVTAIMSYVWAVSVKSFDPARRQT